MPGFIVGRGVGTKCIAYEVEYTKHSREETELLRLTIGRSSGKTARGTVLWVGGIDLVCTSRRR